MPSARKPLERSERIGRNLGETVFHAIRPPACERTRRDGGLHGKMPGFAQKSSGIIMEAERQNQLAARLADYAEREQALRRYL